MNRQLQLTPNKTLFEYDDSIGEDNNIIYHPGYIRIDEIPYYQQFRWETINTNTTVINNICRQLYQTIHDRNYQWIYQGDLEYRHHSDIMTKILSRLKCIYDDYNEYIPFSNLNLRYTWDGEEYQTNLANYIINYFVTAIGENETIKIFAKHFGNIISYLFNQ